MINMKHRLINRNIFGEAGVVNVNIEKQAEHQEHWLNIINQTIKFKENHEEKHVSQ